MKALLTIVMMVMCSTLFGQVHSSADSTGLATITTEPAGADVYVDSILVGKSPLKGLVVSRGAHLVKAYYPSVFAWNAVMKQDSLTVSGSDEQKMNLVLGTAVRILSDPPGGIVQYEGTDLGTTPLFVRLTSQITGDLVVQKEGYDSLLLSPSELQQSLLRVRLTPKHESGLQERPSDVVGVNGRIPKDYVMAYASGATMIASGVASAYIKDRANKHFDLYLQTNNPADLTSARRLDRGAAATLILSQISFAVLAYFLLAE
jgi:hypothetical protein